MKKLIVMFGLILMFVLYHSLCFASTGKLSGFVFDKSTSKPIPDANIIIEGTQCGAASQSGGYFFIKRIPQGTYNVSVRVIGYKTETIKKVKIKENTTINFYLTPQPVKLDPIIVTATLSEHRQSQVTTSSEVYTSAQLNQQIGKTVGEVLESTAGLYIKNYDGFAGILTPSIRGANTNQVVVLLDGLRLNTAQGGGVNLNAFPVANLEKIEVIRGGHSALTGSDAVGGAIHIITRESIPVNGFSYGINSTVGSFGTRNLNISGSHQIGAFSYFINFNHTQSDGNFEYKMTETNKVATRENNDYKANNLFLKTRYLINPKNKFQLIYHNLSAKKGVAGSVNINPWTGQPLLTPNARADEDRQLFSLQSDNQLTDWIRLQNQVYYHIYNFHYKDPDGWTPTDDKHENSSYGINLHGQILLTSHLKMITGLELRKDKLKSTKFTVDDRNAQSAFVQTEIRYPVSITRLLSHWTWIPALRWDNYSDVGSHITPKLGLLISTGEELSFALRGNYGSSYRVPTFDDLYWPDEGWGHGNPNLKPESSTNLDVGFIIKKNESYFLQAEVSYFQNKIKDLIGWGPDNSGIWTPLNIGQAKIQGIESGLKFSLPKEIAYFNIYHTWMKATDETDNSPLKGKRLIYRPDHKIDLIIGTHFGDLSANMDLRIVSKRYTTTDNSNTLPKYQLLNGNIGYSFALYHVQISSRLQILNMLDKSIYLNDGYPLPGREFRLTFGFNY